MQHRATAALAASALVLGGLAAVTVSTPAGATGGWRSFAGSGFGTIPDGGGGCPSPGVPKDVTFTVSGVPVGQLADVRVRGLEVTHAWVADLTATLIGPDGTHQVLFGRTGALAPANLGDSSNLAGPYTFTDRATPPQGGWWPAASATDGTTALPAGDYFATARGEVGTGGTPVSLTGAFAGMADPNGTWRLRFVDTCAPDAGTVTAATLDLRTSSETCVDEQAEVAFQQSAAGAASTAVGLAQQAATSAATALTVQDSAVASAKKAVKKAKTRRAKARARARLAKALLAQSRAQGPKATADAGVVAATAAQAAAQTGVNRAQGALAACQSE